MDSWQRYSLKDLCSIVRGGSPRPISQYITSGEGYNWLKIGDTQNISKYIYQTKQKIKKEGLKKTRLVHKNDFILSNSMSFGKPFIMQTEACIHDGWLSLSISDPSVLDTDFLYYLLSSQLMFRKFNERAAGSSVRNLKIELVNEVEVYLPPLPEQKAIADILQAWDTAIEKTEALIAAKEKQFSWLKKQLFDGGFKSYSGKLADYASIPRQTKITSINGLRLLTVKLHCNGIKANERDVQIFLSDKGRPYYQRKSGDFLIGRQNFHNGGFGIVPEELDGFIASNAITTLELDNSKLDTQYLFFFFSRKDYYLRISHIMDGTGQKELSDKQIMKLPVSIPNLEKQQKVVHILNTANSEIDALKTLADRYRTQKRGLMQKLLTGEWRVRIETNDQYIEAK